MLSNVKQGLYSPVTTSDVTATRTYNSVVDLRKETGTGFGGFSEGGKTRRGKEGTYMIQTHFLNPLVR